MASWVSRPARLARTQYSDSDLNLYNLSALSRPHPPRVAQPLIKVPRCHDQILNDQILNDSAAAAPPQKPELGSSTDTVKPRVAAVATVAAAPKPHRPWLMFHRLPAVLNRLASMLRAVSAVVNRRASDYRRGTYSEKTQGYYLLKVARCVSFYQICLSRSSNLSTRDPCRLPSVLCFFIVGRPT